MTLKKIEKINVSALKKIIVNLRTIIKDFGIDISDNSIYKDHGIDKYDGIETILRKYLKKANSKGIVNVKYNQRDNKGRYFADKCLSLQNIKRQFRQTISHEFYDDIDMVNAHPVILLHLCKKNNINTPYLSEYVNNRDKILKDTGLSRDKAKQLYLIIMNSSDTNINTVNEHMKNFKNEMKNIHETFFNLNKYEAQCHIYKRKLSGRKDNMKASYVNSLMCDMENNILMEIMKFYDNPDDCVLCFDGIMLRKGKRKSINKCMKHIKKVLNIDMKLKIKEMDEVLDLSKYEEVDKIPTDNRVYHLYKKLPTFNKVPDYIFNRKYVNENKEKSYFTDFDHNIVLKSDTGTGKTTAFVKYVKETNCKFISLISLISVGDQQHKSFLENNIDCVHYKLHFGKFFQDNNILITLDSIQKIRHIDFSEYTLYLDEFSSLIEYLHTSSTLDNKRVLCYKIFVRLIRKCKKIICTDADIGSICLKFFDLLGIKYKYHKNEFNNCQDVKADEVECRNDILLKVMKLDKFMICTDSKTEAIALSKDLNDPDIVTITSEYKGTIDISDIKKLIISPKVLYGADSTMEREVFVVYKEHTITAKQMIQQLNRCRNIKKIWYYFPNKKIVAPKFETVEDVKYMIDVNDSICDFEECCSEELSTLFKTIYSEILYEWDCVETNKFLHFKNTMRDRGVDDIDKNIKNKKEKLTTRKELIEEKLKDFNVDELKTTYHDDGTVELGKYNDINNGYLHIPDDKLEEYKEYLVDDILLSKHFAFCQFFFKKDEIEKLEEAKEFRARKITSSKGKMMVLREICNTYDVTLNQNEEITCKTNDNKEVNNKMVNLYKASFRCQSKNLNFNDQKTIIKTIVSVFKQLFGKEIINAKTIGGKNNRHRIYKIDNDYFNRNKNLYEFRHYNDNDNDIEKDFRLELNGSLFK